MAAPLDLRNPHRTIHVGVLLFGGVTEILDVAPVDIFHGISKAFIDPLPDEFVGPEHKAQALDFQFHWVSEAGPSQHAKLTSGISLKPTDSFDTCPPLDIVLVGASHIGYEPNEAEVAYTRKAFDECTAFLTICAGVDALVRIGALEGKTATAPDFMIDLLRKASPATNWVQKRWARDGKIWTSGTLLNGTDMVLAFAKEHWETDENSLITMATRTSGWPHRDVDFKDDPWLHVGERDA